MTTGRGQRHRNAQDENKADRAVYPSVEERGKEPLVLTGQTEIRDGFRAVPQAISSLARNLKDDGGNISTVKEEVQELLKRLPDNCTLEDVQYHLYVLEKIARGVQRAEVEGTVPQEEVEKRPSQCTTE